MTRLKDAKYKGVKMKFFRDKKFGVVYADAYGIGVLAQGRTKRTALDNAKVQIRYKKRRGNIR